MDLIARCTQDTHGHPFCTHGLSGLFMWLTTLFVAILGNVNYAVYLFFVVFVVCTGSVSSFGRICLSFNRVLSLCCLTFFVVILFVVFR